MRSLYQPFPPHDVAAKAQEHLAPGRPVGFLLRRRLRGEPVRQAGDVMRLFLGFLALLTGLSLIFGFWPVALIVVGLVLLLWCATH